MTHTRDDLEELTEGYLAIMPELEPSAARVAVGLWRQLVEGSPVSRDDLAARLSIPRGEVDVELDGPLKGTYLADDGAMTAFWALSLSDQPSPHRLLVDGETRYAWCAPDTLFLPLLVDRTLRVQSELTTTGEPISLVVHPDRLGEVSVPDAIVSFVPPAPQGLGDSPASIMSTYCHHQLFFPSEESGQQWASEHGHDLVFAPLPTAFDACQRWYRSWLGSAL